MADKVNVNPRYMRYNTAEMQALLEEVENRTFFSDTQITDEEMDDVLTEEPTAS